MAHLLLYDGVCGLCSKLVQFVLAHDRKDWFRFAPLQGPLAAQFLTKYHHPADDLESVHVVADFGTPSERLLSKGQAVVFVGTELDGVWKSAGLLKILPNKTLDALYDRVAHSRYRWFGHVDVCAVGSPETRVKFIGLPGSTDTQGVAEPSQIGRSASSSGSPMPTR